MSRLVSILLLKVLISEGGFMQLCVTIPSWSLMEWLELAQIVVLTVDVLLILSLSKVIMGHTDERRKAKTVYIYRV